MNTPFVFFGTSRISVIILDELKNKFGIIPSLIVTVPDRPVGRKHVLTSSPVKTWADENKIPTLQPEKLKDEPFIERLKKFDLFILASYGKIIPKIILDVPSLGMINIHPSLLPHYRGASPIQYQILNDEENVGSTIMQMDEGMDHGPIIAQKKVAFPPNEFPASYLDVEERLAKESAALLALVLPKWINKDITPIPQDHDKATYTKILSKEDAELDLTDDPYKNYLKYLAYHEWPKVFFFTEMEDKKNRVIVTEAEFENGTFIIKKVVPEGKKEIDFELYLQGIRSKEII